MTYHGPTSLEELMTWARNRPKRDDFAVFGVDGLPGKGKSSLVLQLAEHLYPLFDPMKHIAFRNHDILPIARSLPPGGILDIDEAIAAGGNKRRSMSRENVDNMEFLNTTRKRRIILFYIAPFYGDMDKAIREHMHWLLRVDARGEGTAYECQRVGMQSPKIWLEERFRFEFPDCRTARPELWAAYKARSDQYMGGEDSMVKRREMVDLYRSRLRTAIPARLPHPHRGQP